MKQLFLAGLLFLGLAGCATTGGTDRGPEVSGSEAIVAEGHDILAYVSVGGVT